jgi:hypothetical protein
MGSCACATATRATAAHTRCQAPSLIELEEPDSSENSRMATMRDKAVFIILCPQGWLGVGAGQTAAGGQWLLPICYGTHAQTSSRTAYGRLPPVSHDF